jgi:hypothetical protein
MTSGDEGSRSCQGAGLFASSLSAIPIAATWLSDSQRGEAHVTNRSLDVAKLIFEAEPEAALGDPAAVDRVTVVLAKIVGAILASTLLRHGEEALAKAVTKTGIVMEQEARRTASIMRVLEDDSGDPPDAVN